MFSRAFPGDSDPIATANVTKALACFERSIISARSRYDRYHYGGEDNAISASQNAARSSSSISATPVSAATVASISAPTPYNLAGALSHPAENLGIYEYTKTPADVGKFKAPTLRNIAVTAPYMHDGSIRTLGEVLDHYAVGGRAHGNPNRDALVQGFACRWRIATI